ncbi:hypothetical protein FBU59_006716, partial [Linderina macrospora]
PPPVVPQPAQPGVTVIFPQPAQPGVTVIFPQPPQPSVTEVVPSAPPAVTDVVPSAPPAATEVVPSAPPAPTPAPTVPATPSYRTNAYNKRDIQQSAIDNLVNGNGAMMFNINGQTYMLLRLPVSIPQAQQASVPLHKRDTPSSLIDEATTKDLASEALLYEVLGKVFARVLLPANAHVGISQPAGADALSHLLKRDLVPNLLGEVIASAVAPLSIVANIQHDANGNGLVPNLLGDVSATILASPTVTAHILDSGDDSGALLKRDLLNNVLGEVIASVVAPLNIVANINPDEDGNGLVPNLLGAVSATIMASPTVTAHIFDAGDNSGDMLKRDLVPNLLGEVIASAVAPLNIVANIQHDADGNGLVPNLLGDV